MIKATTRSKQINNYRWWFLLRHSTYKLSLFWLIPNPMATLYCAEHVDIAQTRTRIHTSSCCIGQESESESVPESVTGNPQVNKYYL